MIPITDPRIEHYLQDLRPAPHPIQAEMEQLAAEQGFPIIGPEVATLLAILVATSDARTVFELGSGFGYSAWWIARALPQDGVVHCTELDEGNIARGRDFLERAGLTERVKWHHGSALAALAQHQGHLDMILCDIDKEDYPAALSAALPRLAPGGLFVCDNTLWYGRVADPAEQDAATRGVRQLNQMIKDEPTLESVLVPLRDGLTVARRRDARHGAR